MCEPRYAQRALVALALVLSSTTACSSSKPKSEASAVTTDAGGLADSGVGPSSPEPDAVASAGGAAMPMYTETGELLRPGDWETWVLLGSSLNLNYVETPYPTDVLSNVYMEPTAYGHFQETGEFRQGTMTVLVAYSTASGAPPAVNGLYPDALVAFEMSVKDAERHPDVWGYYSFGTGPSGTLNPPAQCFACHDEHAETDHVFTQFYPILP